jgi:hypothetical protein
LSAVPVLKEQGSGDREAARVYFDPSIAGKRVLADGGGEVPGTGTGAREVYAGTLTGRRMDQGDPPWRWLELGELTEKPEGFTEPLVWCEESYTYFQDE